MKIPQPISHSVDIAISSKAKEKKPRTYMGGSILGEKCDRKLWYDYKMPHVLDDPRILRIMDLGNKIEDMVIDYLKQSGLTVYNVDENGKQFGFEDGAIAGNIDGVVVGLQESDRPHLFECKSAKASRYKEFEKGDLKEVEPKYWAQIQVYMHYMGLERCLYVIYNKDTSEMSYRRYEYSKEEALEYIKRGKWIAGLEEHETERAYKSKAWKECKWCNYSERCWNQESSEPIEKSPFKA
jgi:hypothetical protein